MELIAFAALAVVLAAYLVGVNIYHFQRGHVFHAGRFWRAGWSLLLVVAVSTAALAGVGALIAVGPWLLGIALALVVVGKVTPRILPSNRVAAPRQTLDARLTELRQQGPLPPWAADIEARRKRGVLERLDEWMERL